ncbi:sterile alpha motif domain-containing protein 14-like isoform X1 [Ictalurus furcatus]|uniref:sterile alpha motif domain-containing protein 14-like isoform X1 n=1 Tax=Ictalurus furcatus TaxID=66913 RepID=UPI00234FF84A|nr:sterile alpha motif domain-containing protein 14-like isoform X1 [Ictalurus furcatus]XP_053469304.1 sterile alpha motif domain-containing protein 14-like isoform X1 [Ictalurus furcatus]
MQLDETDSVFADLNSVIPETELLDNSIQKSRAPLPLKSRRNRPSRSRLTDSLSSTEGDEGPDTRSADTPLHSAPVHSFLRDSTLTPELLLSSFDSALARRSPEDPKAHRYRQLTNTTSHDALLPPVPPSPCRSCPETSPVHFRRGRRPESEVLVSDDSQDDNIAESDSPTVVLDKKTKRRFLDLGVTLRRSYVRVKKDNAKRFSLGSRELCENSSRHSGSFVPFSWFSDSHRSSSTSSSPRMVTHSRSPSKSDSQESAFSDEFSPKSPLAPSESRSSHHPYQTLSQSSDERADEPQCVARSWSTQQVCDWLKSLNMEQYVPEFRDKDVDGELLLQMDGTKLKALGVLNSSDRSVLKRRIKDIHAAAEKERKALDKLEKQREKQRKKDQEQRKS